MAILRGEEARQWLAQNPNSMFTDLNTGRAYNTPAQPIQQPKKGQNQSTFTNLLMGLSKPFRHGLGIAGEFGGTISDLVKIAQGRSGEIGDDVFRDLGGLLLSDEEKKYIEEDPLQAGLKSGAGVLSYGLGGAGTGATKGARILSAAGKGALASGVGGFGHSEEGKELESTLTGAATGAALGAAFQGLGELGKMKTEGKIQKGKTKPSYTTKELLGQEPETISSVGGKKKADRINEVFDDVTRGDNRWLSSSPELPEGKQIKFKTITPNQRLDAVEQIKPLVIKKGKEIAAGSTKQMAVDEISSRLAEDRTLRRINELADQTKGGYGWAKDMNDNISYVVNSNSTGGVMSVPQMNQAVQDLDDLALGFSNLDGGTQPLNYLGKVRKIFRGALGELEPALNYPKEIYSLLTDATKPMERLASQSKKGLRFFGTEWPLTGETLRPIMDAITRGSNVVRSGVMNIPSTAPSALGSLGNTGLIQGGAPISAMANIGGELGKLFSREETGEEPQAGMSSLYGAMGAQQPQYTVNDAFAEAQQMMPKANISQLTTLAKMLLDENQTSLSKDDIAVQNVASIIDEIEDMTNELGLAKTGLGASLGGVIRSGYGSAVRSSPEAIFKDTRRGLSSKLSRALGEVGMLTDQDIERAIGMIPTLSDTQASARDRLSRLRRLLSKMQAGSQQGYSQQEVYDDMGTGY